MAKAARIKSSDIVLDPFGGAGFSSLVAAHFNPKKMIISDLLYGRPLEPTPRDVEFEWADIERSLRKTRLTVVSADAGKLPFSDSSVDKIISSPPYNLHLRSRSKSEEIFEPYVAELARVLKNNGLLVLKVPAFWNLRYAPFHGFGLLKRRRLDQHNQLAVFQLKKQN